MRIAMIGTVSILWNIFAAEETPAMKDELLMSAAANVASMHRVTEKPFKMDAMAATLCRVANEGQPHNPHRDYYCHVFVSESGLSTMQAGKGEYPAGTVIVKQKFADRKAKQVELYTLMRKMPKGYDADHGDWEYSIVNRTASKVLSRGRTESCVECHKQFHEADYVTRLYMKPGDK